MTAALCATALCLFWFHHGNPAPRAAEPPGAREAAVPPQAMSEIRVLFAEYVKLHAAKEMEKWRELFLPEANCVNAAADGSVYVYSVAQMARNIAEESKTVKAQQLTLDETRIEVHGNAASYAATHTVTLDGKPVRHGRSFFSLVKKDGNWKIAALVWSRD